MNRYKEFLGVEEVWFWYCSSEMMLKDSAFRKHSDYPTLPRKCETSDIYRIVRRMRANGEISSRHLNVMYKFGTILTSPWAIKSSRKIDLMLWSEAMSILEKYLIVKGIL